MARRARDYAAEYARRQELARQRGFRSYGQRRYAAEKAKKQTAEGKRVWPKSTFKKSKRKEPQNYIWYYKVKLKMDNGDVVYRTITVRNDRNLSRDRLAGKVRKELRTRHSMGFDSMGSGAMPQVLGMELDSAFHA